MRLALAVLAALLASGCHAAPRPRGSHHSPGYVEDAKASRTIAAEASTASEPLTPFQRAGFAVIRDRLHRWVEVVDLEPGHVVHVYEDGWTHKRWLYHFKGGFLVLVEPA